MTEREQERADIVAWLLAEVSNPDMIRASVPTMDPSWTSAFNQGRAYALNAAADAIERGAHLSTESEETHD